MSARSWPAHEDPIHHIALSSFGQEIRSVIVLPQFSRLVVVAGAPTHVPRRSRQVSASFIHAEHFLERVETGFVGEEEAIVHSFTHLSVAVEVSEEIETEFL